MSDHVRRNPADTALGRRIRDLREFREKTQRELAQELGMKEDAYRHNESGLSQIPADRLKKIARLLDCSVSYLLGEEDLMLTIPDREWLGRLARDLEKIPPGPEREARKREMSEYMRAAPDYFETRQEDAATG